MSQFQYKAKTSTHKIVTGEIDAETLDNAVRLLLEKGFVPVDVRPFNPMRRALIRDDSNEKDAERVRNRMHVPLIELSIFTRQLADLISAGVTIVRALELLFRQTRHPVLKELINDMRIFVKDGGSLSNFLSSNPGVFPPAYLHMVKCGEDSGKLSDVLAHLAELIEANVELQKKVRGGLMYPLMILVVGLGTIFVLLTFVLPKLTVIFDDFNAALPLPTRIVIDVSRYFAEFWWLIIGIVGGSVFYVMRWYSSDQGRLFIDQKILTLPVLRRFIYEVDMARFSRGLGTLVGNGVPVSSALESSLGLLENSVLHEEMRKVAGRVRSGSSLSNALKGNVFFEDLVVSLISVGEESGHLEQGLYKLTAIYERNVRQTIELFVNILGPAVLVCVVFIVGGIVLAVLLPILNLNLIVN